MNRSIVGRKAHPDRAARLVAPLVALAALAGLAACASTPPPTEQLAVTTAAVARAAGAGGAELASADMRTAREKLDKANLAMAAKDYDLALTLAQEAQVDARLAEVRARTAKAQSAAGELSEASRVLREELDRKSK